MSPRQFTADPNMIVRAKVVTLWASLVAVVTCTICCTAYAVRMDAKLTTALEGVDRIDTYMQTTAPQHVILWNWYERTAARPTANPQQIH